MPEPIAIRNAASEYRKLTKALAARAARLGSSDPEAAAQEAVRRSLADSRSRPAIEYYFREQLPGGAGAPEWTLLQLVGWLHGVVNFVVREERARAQARHERSGLDDQVLDGPDPSPSQLEHAIEAQHRALVEESLSALAVEQRSALLMRLRGIKYSEIAARLGVNENTAATWIRRGSLELMRQVRERLENRQDGGSAAVSPTVVRASNA